MVADVAKVRSHKRRPIADKLQELIGLAPQDVKSIEPLIDYAIRRAKRLRQARADLPPRTARRSS